MPELRELIRAARTPADIARDRAADRHRLDGDLRPPVPDDHFDLDPFDLPGGGVSPLLSGLGVDDGE